MNTHQISYAADECPSGDTLNTLKAQGGAQEPPVWDLSFVYAKGIDDPKIEQDAAEAITGARAFKLHYEGKLANQQLSAEQLKKAIQDLERIDVTITKPYVFLEKLLAVNQNDTRAKALLGKIKEKFSECSALTAFFRLELARSDETYIRTLLDSGELDNYREFVAQIRQDARYLLSLAEEELLSKLSPLMGSLAELREEFETNFVFHFQGPDDTAPRAYSSSELASLFSDPDARVRYEAKELYLQEYHKYRTLFATVYSNVIRQSLVIKENVRGYESTFHARNIVNGLDDEDVHALLNTTRANFSVPHRLWRAKKLLLGLPRFQNTDIYAPYVTNTDAHIRVSWDEAVSMVLEAYGRLSPEFAQIFRTQCLEQNRVHARPMPGKRGGAFMSPLTQILGPVWFMNFTGRLEDVKTFAHEGGHWMHSKYSQEQTEFNYNVDMVRAETASTFGEMLVTDLLLDRYKDNPQAKLSILIKTLDNLFATIFRQSVFAMFELDAFKEVRETGAASADRLEELFVKNYGELFGDAVEHSPHFKAEWSYIPHFVNSPYYVYAYSAANLVVIAMYQKWREDGATFGEKIIGFLRKGGSLSTKAAYAELGIDVGDPSFWQKGFDYLDGLVREVETLVVETTAQRHRDRHTEQ